MENDVQVLTDASPTGENMKGAARAIPMPGRLGAALAASNARKAGLI